MPKFIKFETYISRNCAVYEFTDIYGKCKFWVDFETGCLLKAQNLDTNELWEVLVFKLNDLQWDSSLRPEPYSSIIMP